MNLRKSEDDDMDASTLYQKFLKSLLECLVVITFIASRDANRSRLAESRCFYLHRRTNGKTSRLILTKHISSVLHKFHMYIFLPVLNSSIQRIKFAKAKHSLHMGRGIIALKHKGVGTTLRLVYHSSEKLAHTIIYEQQLLLFPK